MEYRDREIIDRYCHSFASEIDMVTLWPRLLKNKVFNEDDVNVPLWEEKLTDEHTVRDIISTIKTRGPRAYNSLILSLRQTDHHQLADILQRRDLSITSIGNDDSNRDNNSPSSFSGKDDFYKDLGTTHEKLNIVVRKALFFRDAPENDIIGRYVMRSKPRGYVLVITIISSWLAEPRAAAEHDEENLTKLFQDMGFEVTTRRNLTGAKIKEAVRDFSRKEWTHVDSCFVIISAHGAETKQNGYSMTEIQGTDFGVSGAERVFCCDIYDYFTAKNCKSLIRKPKVFIFQACRGTMAQPIVKIVEDGIVNTGLPRNYDDMLIAHSTLPGHVAYRNNKSGSWYIQILCEVFMNYACDLHLKELFCLIDKRISPLCTIDQKTQTTTTTDIGFNKHCYLNPGLFGD